MVVEIYSKPLEAEKTQNNIDEKAELVSIQEKMPYYLSLGMDTLAANSNERKHVLENMCLVGYPLISPQDWKIWRAWLPRMYYQDANSLESPKNGAFVGPFGRWCFPLSNYEFDDPPLQVLIEWQRAKSQHLFDGYGICTPEEEASDPMLIGVIGQDSYLIARWGESLLDFSEIKRLVQEKEDHARAKRESRRLSRHTGAATLYCRKCNKYLNLDSPKVVIMWKSNAQGSPDPDLGFGSKSIASLCEACAEEDGLLIPKK